MAKSALQYLHDKGTRVSCDTMNPEVPENYLLAHYFNATSNQGISYQQLADEGLENSAIAQEAARHFKDSKLPETERAYQIVYRMYALLGKRMLRNITGCCLTQTNPSLAYDTIATIKNAQDIIRAYESVGVPSHKVVVKVPSTWEGLQACQVLSSLGINTLGTVLYTLEQATLAAQVGCVAISQYINDIRKKVNPSQYKPPANILDHRGIQLNRQIQHFYWQHGVKTRNCPACFIQNEELIALAGVDEVTCAPDMLNDLYNWTDYEIVEPIAKDEMITQLSPIQLTEAEFKAKISANEYATQNIEFALKRFTDGEYMLLEMAKKALTTV